MSYPRPTLEAMVEVLQALMGLLVLIGFWWAVCAVIRLFEPARPRRLPALAASPAPAAPRSPPVGRPQPARRRGPCCPDCTPGCPEAGLAMGQAWGGDDWHGEPFGADGPNPEAMVFWGDGCCPDCPRCAICRDE